MDKKPHHLAGKPKSLDQRAKIAASKVLRGLGFSPEENPRLWQSEYEIAYFRLQQREQQQS